MQSIPIDEREVIDADFNSHVGEGKRGDEEVMDRSGIQDRNAEGQRLVDFTKRMNMAAVNTYFQMRQGRRQ